MGLEVRLADERDWPAIAYGLGHPTEGEFAVEVWQLCSSGRLPVDDAKAMYRACGYIPFCGYPLSRSGLLHLGDYHGA